MVDFCAVVTIANIVKSATLKVNDDAQKTKHKMKCHTAQMKKSRGFTLIELLVVIAIIGILSSVVLASLTAARKKSRDARRTADFKQIMLALELYYDAKGYYPGIYQGWFNKCPTAPATPCWDINAYNASNNTGWAYLQTELSPYLTRLPSDPLNTGSAVDAGNDGKCVPWQPNCFIYAYGNVGRNGVNPNNAQATKPNTYDLVAQLEDDANIASCKNQDYSAAYGASISGAFYWCSHGNTYPSSIYDPSPN